MTEIDHDAAIAKVRQLYTAEGYLGVPPTKEQCLYVADLAERAKRLEEALRSMMRSPYKDRERAREYFREKVIEAEALLASKDKL